MTKTSQVVQAYTEGDLRKALQIAKTFRLGLTRDEAKAISLAYDCLTHPEFYRQIGINLDQSIQAGKDVLEHKIV